MAEQLLAMLKKAMTEKAAAADISALTKKISEAKNLYSQVKDHTGTDKGEYGKLEVQALNSEIAKAEKIDKFNTQSTIDNEVIALDDAMIEVKASLVQDAVRIFTDKATGIVVIVPSDALPAKVGLIVRRLDRDSHAYRAMKKNLDRQETRAILYDIQFYSGGYKVSPSKRVEVQMPVPESMDGMTAAVSRVDSAGRLSRMTTAMASGIKIFKTGRLGKFAMTAHRQTENERKALTNAKSSRQMTVIRQSQKSIKSKNKNKERELKKKLKNKEDYKTPSADNAVRQNNNASFNNNVTRKADPVYLIAAAVILAVIAAALGIRALLGGRRRRR